MESNFFSGNTYFIDEKVNMFKFENAYRVYDGDGQQLGNINQKLTGGQKALRLVLNKKMLPFLLEIRDAQGQLQATISRGWTFFMSKITIADANGTPVGQIKQKFTLLKPAFNIVDMAGIPLGYIKGDFVAWDFKITDAKNQPIGVVNKKWAGALKELFTSADKYHVHISGALEDTKTRIAIISAAVTIDMVLKENK